MKVAYALRKEYVGTVLQREDADDEGTEVPKFLGGLIAAGDEDLNVGELLEDGDGVIVVDEADSAKVQALDEYPPLKRVRAPSGEGADEPDDPRESQTVKSLREDVKERGIEGHSADGVGKPELVAALGEHDRRLSDDTLDELEAPLSVAVLERAAAARAADDPDPDDQADAGQEA